MTKTTLTDRTLKSLKPAPAGKRYDIFDSVVPGLGIRVTDKGQRTFVLVKRLPGAKNPTRRALGEYGALSLEGARQKARGWIELIGKGTDPAHVEERARVAAARSKENTVATVAELFIKRKVAGTRKAQEVERDIRGTIIARWGTRPISEITRQDVVALIDEIIDRDAPYQAHNVLGYARRLFNWAISRDSYGLEHSPCDRLKPKDLIGAKKKRKRTLSDEELRILWRVTKRMPYPYGPLFQLWMLTGQRSSEVAKASRGEFEPRKALWTIPPERMKGDAPHLVPMPPPVVKIWESLPRFNSGEFLFSTTFGKKPVSGFSKVKLRVNMRMLSTMRALARMRGADPAKVKLDHWVIHDIRRTVRTHLSALPVEDIVRELVIAHAQPELHQVYDQYAYLDEKRRALELWAARLLSIVNPAPDNVIPLNTARVY
jgi:integrase